MDGILDTRRAHLIIYQRFYYYHLVDISAGGLVVSDGITCLVVSASTLTLTWFIIYLNNVISYLWNM